MGKIKKENKSNKKEETIENKERIIKDINEIDDQSENQSLINTVISFSKKLSFGSELSKISFPASLTIPKSTLSYVIEYFSNYFNLLFKVNEIEDPLQRLLQVYRYLITIGQVPSNLLKKPLNPVLGETFEAEIIFSEDGAELKDKSIHKNMIFCEQISHHPPITSNIIYNKEAGIKIMSTRVQKLTFQGTHIIAHFEGDINIHFEKWNETYSLVNSPMVALRFLRGFVELIGESKMVVNNSNLRIHSKFHEKPLFYGSANNVDAKVYSDNEEKIYNIKGKFTDHLQISEYGKDQYEPFFNIKDYKKGTIIQPDIRLTTDSSNVWRDLFNEFDKNSPARILSKEKEKVEEEQRRLAADRKKKGETWTPQHFIKDENGNYKFKEFL